MKIKHKTICNNFQRCQCILLIIHLGKTLFFHSNLSFKTFVLHQFPTFYANILQSWKRNFSYICYIPSCIGSRFLWFNNCVIIDNNYVHIEEFSSHNINFINHLFTSEGEFKDWNHIKREFQLTNNLYYKFKEVSYALPKKQKTEWRLVLYT